MEEAWSRGCGSGIGLSGHKNRYEYSVLINNFVEDRARVHYPERCDEPTKHSCYQFSYVTPDFSAVREVHEASSSKPDPQGQGAAVLTDHGIPGNPRMNASAGLHPLAYRQPALQTRQVESHLWAAHKRHNLKVIQAVPREPGCLERKHKQWEDDIKDSACPFSSIHRVDFASAAISATAPAGREGTNQSKFARRTTDVRRTPGEEACQALHYRHPLPYTVVAQPSKQESREPASEALPTLTVNA